MEWFDCNAAYGDSGRPPYRHAPTADDLIAELDFCGIDRALVYHAGQRFGSPQTYNPRLAAELQDRPRLAPVWAILPWQTGEMLPPAELVAAMRAQGIRALRAFPQGHHYRLDGRTFGPLLELMIARRIPLLVKDHLAAIGDLLDDFPALRVVAMNQGPHSLERYLRPMVEAFPQLYVDTSYYLVDGLLEEFCERYGPNRLLYGSGFPDNCSGASLLRLAGAALAPDQKQAIAAGNLQRLLREVDL
ncbi:amidohydrolase family protein [bacterium]|nr:amidohydrolase family protein [bacterium]